MKIFCAPSPGAHETPMVPFTLWHYESWDTDVMEPGYFDEAASLMRVGDFIILNIGVKSFEMVLVDGTHPETSHGMVVVKSNAAGKVCLRSIPEIWKPAPPQLREWLWITFGAVAIGLGIVGIIGIIFGLTLYMK